MDKTKTKKAVTFKKERDGGVDFPVATIKTVIGLLPGHLEHLDAYKEMARRLIRIVSRQCSESDLADLERGYNDLEVRALLVAMAQVVVDEDYHTTMPERFHCEECGQRGEGDIEDHYDDCDSQA